MNGTRLNGFESFTLNALRIVAGLLFLQHGVQKIFGWLEGNQVETIASMMGAAGIIETIGAVLLVVGLFTRPVALIAAVEMLVAYFFMHVGQVAETTREALYPILNGGELAALYCFIWLLVVAFGPGKFSLDAWMKRRKAESLAS